MEFGTIQWRQTKMTNEKVSKEEWYILYKEEVARLKKENPIWDANKVDFIAKQNIPQVENDGWV